jgi:hypothetical protein
MIVLTILWTILVGGSLPESAAFQSSTPACREWRECQQQALEAAGRKEYEAFHDLSWRAVQLGPRQDPSLMFMLARAQCLSGRPHDALVMLRRIASSGIAAEAITSEDFKRTRDLPGWPEVQALIEGVPATAAPPPAPSPRASRAPAASPETSPAIETKAAPPIETKATSPVAVNPATVDQPVRLASGRFAAGGLAYDAVSHRFVVGDQLGRKLVVVGEGADHAVDLVRADSAGFQDIRAVEIDGRRGDLWVASAAGTDWTIHRMQLVSGRPLKSIQASANGEPMNLVDLGVTPAGNVLAVDAAAGRLLVLRPGAATLEVSVRLPGPDATSIAATGDEDVAYIAYGAGISRIDRHAKTVVNVSAGKGVQFGRIERIRWHRNALIAVQTDDDGVRRVVRFDLNRSGRTVTAMTPLDTAIPAAGGPTFATIAGDELCYLVTEGDGSGTQLSIRRMKLP